MHHDAQLILVAGALLASGVAASVVATRLRVPALVLFLAVGMAIGTDGLGWIDFDDYALARLIGSIALVVILYEGGLESGWPAIRSVLRPAVSMAVIATVVTAAIAGLAAAALLSLSVKEGVLLGAILSGTDGAAVFALLRGTKVPSRLARILEGEAGFNDPVAVLLVLVTIKVLEHPGYGVLDGAWFLVHELGVGAAAGAAVGGLAAWGLQRGAGSAPALSVVASLAAAAIAFGLAGVLGGSGFLAVYVAGLLVGRAPLPERPTLLAFHLGLASVAEIGLFLALGLLVFPSQLDDVAVKSVALALVLALVARPVATALATTRSGLGAGERAVLSWAGLRGAVPVVLATLPVIANVPRSVEFFDVVFFAVIVSTLLQGSTVGWLARRVGLSEVA